jgi:transcriptional regulator with XRE-family HTH domain
MIGRRIQEVRKERGFPTAAALADAIEDGSLTTSVLQNIESGRKSDITVGELVAIAQALGVAPSVLDDRLHVPGLHWQAGYEQAVADMRRHLDGIEYQP